MGALFSSAEARGVQTRPAKTSDRSSARSGMDGWLFMLRFAIKWWKLMVVGRFNREATKPTFQNCHGWPKQNRE